MRVLVLAGGSDQIALINELKGRGHYVILVDYFENPPAKPFADQHIVASTLDVDRVREIAVSEKIDLICTACTDQALLTVAKVSEELNLPCYISYQTALNVTNKTYMKRRMMECGVPTSRYMITQATNESQFEEFSYPLVVKPADCNSSKGVRRVADSQQLRERISEAISMSRTGTAIVEEFKEGIEVTADFYVEGTEVKFLSATSSIKMKNKDSFTIISSVYPVVSEVQRIEIIDIAKKIVAGFGLRDCPLLIQMIVNDSEINVIEFSARMGGGSKYHLIKVLSGVDIMSVYVDRVLGQLPTVSPQDQVKFCRMNYIYCEPGCLKEVEGLDALKEEGIVSAYFIYKTEGMQITASSTSGDRAAGYLVIADSEEELIMKQRNADKNLKVLDLNGRDIMIHNLV